MNRIIKFFSRYLIKELFPPLPKEAVSGVIRRGELAKELVANPIFKQFMEDSRARLYRDFISSQVMNSEAREKIYAIAKALDMMEIQLSKYVSEAVLEARSAEMREKLQKEN